eukprot:6479496-Amphidinium_carterae.1
MGSLPIHQLFAPCGVRSSRRWHQPKFVETTLIHVTWLSVPLSAHQPKEDVTNTMHTYSCHNGICSSSIRSEPSDHIMTRLALLATTRAASCRLLRDGCASRLHGQSAQRFLWPGQQRCPR